VTTFKSLLNYRPVIFFIERKLPFVTQNHLLGIKEVDGGRVERLLIVFSEKDDKNDVID